MNLFIRSLTAIAALLLSACAVTVREAVAPSSGLPVAVSEPATPTTQPTPTPSPAPTPTATAPRRESPPVVADDPLALAGQITLSERAVRQSAIGGEELAWMGHLQQLTYRRLVERTDWHETVLAALPDDVRPIALANLGAGTDLRALTAPRTELPPWRIIEPAPAEELVGYYRDAEAEFGVPWTYLAAIHLIETRMGRIRGTSIAGAQGPMQFMPATWAAFGEGDVNSDRDSIRAAARYLRHNGAPSNLANALFRYNNSQRYVRAVTAYAEVMRADPVAFRGYYHWLVYYRLTGGDVLLPIGYRRD